MKETRIIKCANGCGTISMKLTPYELLCVLKEMQCQSCKGNLAL